MKTYQIGTPGARKITYLYPPGKDYRFKKYGDFWRLQGWSPEEWREDGLTLPYYWKHRQIIVNGISIDVGMRNLLPALWADGYRTRYSCQEDYIMFDNAEDAAKFHAMLELADYPHRYTSEATEALPLGHYAVYFTDPDVTLMAYQAGKQRA